MRRTKEEAVATREAILRSAELIMFEAGYANSVLLDIATAAGLSRGAIHYHFASKSHLLSCIFAGELEQLLGPDFAKLSSSEQCCVADIEKAVMLWVNDLLDNPAKIRRMAILDRLTFTSDLAGLKETVAHLECRQRRSLASSFDTVMRKRGLNWGWDSHTAENAVNLMVQGIRHELVRSQGVVEHYEPCVRGFFSVIEAQ